jgi:heme-degrading monooxygenase HmoA
MIEICTTYDLMPGMNSQAYADFAKRAIVSTLQAPGLVEFRAHRNMLGSPKVRLTTVWSKMEDWARWAESPAWQAIEAEMLTLTTNIDTEVWGPSPVVPEPLRPSRS